MRSVQVKRIRERCLKGMGKKSEERQTQNYSLLKEIIPHQLKIKILKCCIPKDYFKQSVKILCKISKLNIKNTGHELGLLVSETRKNETKWIYLMMVMISMLFLSSMHIDNSQTLKQFGLELEGTSSHGCSFRPF